MRFILLTFTLSLATTFAHASIRAGETFTTPGQPERTTLVMDCAYLLASVDEVDEPSKQLPPLEDLATTIVEMVRKPYSVHGATVNFFFRPRGDELLIQTINVTKGVDGEPDARVMHLVSILADGTVQYQKITPGTSLDNPLETKMWIIDNRRARFMIGYAYHHLSTNKALAMHSADYLRVELPGVLDDVWPFPPMASKRIDLNRGFGQY